MEMTSRQRKKDKFQIQICEDNIDNFIATCYNVLLEPDLCDGFFSIVTLMSLGHTCLFQKGFFTVYFGDKKKNAVNLPHSA